MRLTMMNPREIGTHPTFSNLFPVKPELLQKIEADMKERHFKYDPSQPVVLATWGELKEPVCIDGHTRIKAAINAGIESIPIWPHEFDTEREALEYAIGLQRNRRNMTDAEIFACIEALDSRYQRGGDRRSEEARSKPQDCGIEESRSASAKGTGEVVGISTRKVEQARTIRDHGGEDILKSVKNGEMSINKAYQETQKGRNGTNVHAKTSEPEADAEVVESTNGSEESSGEKSTNPISEQTSVTLTPEQYKALRDLGESIEYHVELAIDVYLRMLADECEQNDNED